MPEPANNFLDRATFGLEHEFLGLADADKSKLLQAIGDNNYSLEYEPTVRRLLDDVATSKYGVGLTTGRELISGILVGKNEFLASIRRDAAVIKNFGGYTNSTCGFHIHVGLDTFLPEVRIEIIRQFLIEYIESEVHLEGYLRNSDGANPLGVSASGLHQHQSRRERNKNEIINKLKNLKFAGSNLEQHYDDLMEIVHPDYHRDSTRFAAPYQVSLSCFFENKGNLEIRHHQGSLNEEELVSYAELICLMLERAISKAFGSQISSDVSTTAQYQRFVQTHLVAVEP
jgi:hypothetical protein